LPKPEPGPRPTRFFLCVEPFAAFKLLSDNAIFLSSKILPQRRKDAEISNSDSPRLSGSKIS
jgi:hypothetical protein